MKHKLFTLLMVVVVVSVPIIVILRIESSHPQIVENTHDYRDVKVSILKISVVWINQTNVGAPFSLMDKDFNLLCENVTGVSPFILNMTDFCKDSGSYYLNVTFTAHFVEGGDETRYTYFLINYDKISYDTLNITLYIGPAIWERKPTIVLESISG
jgi:hypothetical protein